MKFILTSRLNSDALENLFSQLRWLGGLGSNNKLGGLAFRTCLRNFILGSGDIPIEKASSVADCGAYTLTKNVTNNLLKPEKWGEQLVENESDSMTVIGDLDSILTSMLENDSKTTPTNISVDLEDELEEEPEPVPKKPRKSKKDQKDKQRKFYIPIYLSVFQTLTEILVPSLHCYKRKIKLNFHFSIQLDTFFNKYMETPQP